MKKLTFILFFSSLVTFAQNQQKIDSLKTVLKTTKNDTVKVNAMKDVFKQYIFSNRDSAMFYQEKMFDFSIKKQFDYGLYHAHFYQSYSDYLTGNLVSELKYMNSAKSIAKRMHNDRFLVDVYLRLGSVHSRMAHKDSALTHVQNALKIAKESDFKDQIAFCSLELGNLYTASEEKYKAIAAYQKSDSILSIIDPKHRAIGIVNNNIGLIFESMDDYVKAKLYYNKTKLLYEDINEIRGLVGIKSQLGIVDMKLGNHKEAQSALQDAYTYYKKANDRFRLAEISNYLADITTEIEGLDKALPLYLESLALREEIKDSVGIASANQYLGEYYFKNKAYKESEPYFLKSLELSKQLNRLEHQKSSNYFLSEIYKNTKDYKNALTYLEAYNVINDSINKLNNQVSTQELETKYQTEKKQQEISLLKSQNALSEQQKTNQRNLFLGGLGLTTLAGLFFFFQYRNRQKTNRKLRELDAAKSHFFANISHEFRTPLTLIQSPIEEELEKTDLSDVQRNKFTLIKRNSNRLLSLVDQLLLLSKIEANALKLQVQNTNIHELIAAISSSFEYVFKQSNINYQTKILAEQNGFLDIDFIEKILANLLSNASKYTSDHGKATLDAYVENERLHLKVSNSGTVLNEEQLQNIFNKYYQGNTANEGYGIGLTLIKELTEVHKGNIKASSESGLVTFLVSVPISKSVYSEEDIRSVAKVIPIIEQSIVEIEYPDEDEHDESTTIEKPILLVVEDNVDMRTFIKSLFDKEFDILEAENGKLGIEVALEYIPDIIISDVMMPETDGIALVESLKKDQKTSHIPIILLTAKVEEEYQIKGILTGADDYITKPFSPKLIHAKIETLLANRNKVKDHYSHNVLLKPAIFSINSSEEVFFNKLQHIIDSKLQKPDFNTDLFSQEIGMSRMQLHRKLKATLGVSASEFLRTERLKAARHLLQTSDLSISEVAYSVGFNDANYFSKSFIKLFKMSPSDFKDQSNT